MTSRTIIRAKAQKQQQLICRLSNMTWRLVKKLEADCGTGTNIPLSTGRVHACYASGKTFMNPVIDVDDEVRRRALRDL